MKFFKNIWNIVKVAGAVLTFMLAVVYVTSAFGGKTDPDETTRYAILQLGFPLLFWLSCLVMVVWLVLRQWKVAVIIAVALLVTAEPVITYFPLNILPHRMSDEERQRSFKLLSFNIMNFSDFDGQEHERNRSAQYILDTDADVVCLQEGAHLSRLTDVYELRNILPELLERYPYYTNDRDDMVLLSKFPFKKCDESVVEGSKKVVSYDVYLLGDTIRIYNCHLQSIGLTSDDKEAFLRITDIEKIEPVTEMKVMRSSLFSKLSVAYRHRARQARELRSFIDSTSRENVIVCGDFNDTPGSFSYLTVRGNDLHDAYVDCAFGPTITYHANRFFFKIDQVLYRGRLQAVDIERGNIDSSDHYPLVTTFVLK